MHAGVRFALIAAFFIMMLSTAVRAAPIKVGVITPLSGAVAPMGEAFRKGFELFAKDYPACRENARLIFEDGKYDGKATSSAHQKLTSMDQVALTIVWGNTPASVCAPIAEARKTPLLAVAYTPEARGRKYVLTFGPKTKMLAKKIADEFGSWNLKRPAAITVNIGNTLEEIGYVKEFLAGNFDVEVVPTEETNFRSILTRLRGKQVDGILAFLLPDQAISMAKQALELQYTPPIIGADVFADLEFGERLSTLLPRIGFVYSAVDPQFIKRLRAEYKSSSYFYEVASGYTLAELACQLGKARDSSDSFSIIEAIKSARLESSPIGGLRYAVDEEYGAHFENDVGIYYLSGGPRIGE